MNMMANQHKMKKHHEPSNMYESNAQNNPHHPYAINIRTGPVSQPRPINQYGQVNQYGQNSQYDPNVQYGQ